MAYKANRFFDDVDTAFTAGEQIGGEIPVGIESADKFRVDATLTVGVASDINLETHVGGDVWVVYAALSGALTGLHLPTGNPVPPLGSKVRLKAAGNVTLTKAFITLSR